MARRELGPGGENFHEEAATTDLYYPPDFCPGINAFPHGNRRMTSTLWKVYKEVADELNCGYPDDIEEYVVPDPEEHNTNHSRLLVRFRLNGLLSEEQLKDLDKVVSEAYYFKKVKTRKSAKGEVNDPEFYPLMPVRKHHKITRYNKSLGYFLTPYTKNPPEVDALTEGVLVFRDINPLIGSQVRANPKEYKDFMYMSKFSNLRGQDFSVPERTVIEIRQGASLAQAELMELIMQISQVISGQPISKDVYNRVFEKLTNLQLSESPPELPGTEAIVEEIMQDMLYPIAFPDEARELGVKPKNICLVGLPGVGKTQILKLIMREAAKLNIVTKYMLPVDYMREVMVPDEAVVLPMIPRMKRRTGKDVILGVDDFEQVGGESAGSRTTVLNHLSGASDMNYWILSTTNYPELMTDQMLNQQRLVPIYCPVPHLEGRLRILGMYIERELFENSEDCDVVIQTIATRVGDIDPRNLEAISQEAKRILFKKRRKQNDSSVKLRFEDWAKAFKNVISRFDRKKFRERVEILERFTNQEVVATIGLIHGDNGVSEQDLVAAFHKTQSQLSSN